MDRQNLTPRHRTGDSITVAAYSAARIGVRKQRRTRRANSERVFFCSVNGGLCAGTFGFAGPLPGTPTAHNLPPFIGVKDGSLSTAKETRQ